MTGTSKSTARILSGAFRIRSSAQRIPVAVVVLLLHIGLLCGGENNLAVRDLVVPDYPILARMAHLQGIVIVRVNIDTDGRVVSAKASGGHPVLQHAAERNVRLWTFYAPGGAGELTTERSISYVYKLVTEYVQCPQVVLHLPDRVEISEQASKVQPTGSNRDPKSKGEVCGKTRTAIGEK